MLRLSHSEHKSYQICQINCFRSRDIRGTLSDPDEALTRDKVAAAIKDLSVVSAFPPLNVPAILKVDSPDGQSAILALNCDKNGGIQVM
jgi:hypothetical protein